VHGAVVVELTISTRGDVESARIVQSIPKLDQAALDAVKQWEYTPMRRGDTAVPTTMTVTVNFTRA
jgi:TonB family protein